MHLVFEYTLLCSLRACQKALHYSTMRKPQPLIMISRRHIIRIAFLVIALGLVYFGRNQHHPAPQHGSPLANLHSAHNAVIHGVTASPLANTGSGKTMVNGPAGALDISATLQRIRAGRHLHFHHDGIVFQNREHRLPEKPRGYYHEYVQPTSGDSGPGAQRIIIGNGGEIYYTPDHYRTFQNISPHEP